MNQSKSLVPSISALFISLAIVLGAFGAHMLKGSLEPRDLEIYQTGVFYHLINSIGALVVLALTPTHISKIKAQKIIAVLLTGILIFSGSLYLLVLTNTRWLGAITPIGGTLLIFSWAWLGVELFRAQSKE